MKKFALAWIALAGMASALASKEPQAPANRTAAVAKAMDAFTGVWEIASVQPAGATKNARSLVFRKDGTYAAQDENGKELWAGTFEIDPTVTPKVWDHRSHEGKKEGKDVLGIYELDGDKLKVACVVGQWKEKKWVGKARPASVRSDKADVLIELKRKKSEDAGRRADTSGVRPGPRK